MTRGRNRPSGAELLAIAASARCAGFLGGEIRGTVVDAEGVPLQGVDVYVFRGFRGFDQRMAATRDDGSFHFPRLAPGSYIVMRSRPPGQTGFNSQIRTVEVRAGETKVVNF